jgi:hypothetical protein
MNRGDESYGIIRIELYKEMLYHENNCSEWIKNNKYGLFYVNFSVLIANISLWQMPC